MSEVKVKVGHVNTMSVCGRMELQVLTFVRWRRVIMHV